MRRLALLVGLLACRAPTEITLQISTDVPCAMLSDVAITTGPTGADASQRSVTAATQCDAQTGYIGSLVLIPSGAADQPIAIEVTGRVKQAGDPTVGPCVAPYGPSCIVARRVLKYVAHTPLELPIQLSASCTGLVCKPDETCDKGVCRPATACDSAGCTPPDAGTPVVVQGCGDMRGLQANAQWPMLGYCPTRIGRSPYSGPHIGTSQSAMLLNYGALTSPVIDTDGTVYVAGETALVAVQPDLSLMKWTQPINGPTANVATDTSPVIAADGTVWVGSATHELWAVTSAGATSHAVDFFFGTPVIDPDGVLIFPTGAGGSIRGVDANGTQMFDVPFQTPPALHTVPARGWDGSIFVGTTGQLLVTVHPPSTYSTGDVGPPSYDFEAPLVHPSGLVVASTGGTVEELAVFDANGSYLWNVQLPGAAHTCNGAAVGPDGLVYASTSNGFVPVDLAQKQLGTAVTLDPASTTGSRTPSIGADGTVYIAIGDFLYAVDPTTGQVLFQAQAATRIDSAPAIGKNGWLYFTDSGGSLYSVHD